MTLSKQSRLFSLIVIVIMGMSIWLYIKETEELNYQHETYENVGNIIYGIFELNLLTTEYYAKKNKRTKAQWQQRHASLTNLLFSTQQKIAKNETETLVRIRVNLSKIRSLFFKIIAAENVNASNGQAKNKKYVSRLGSQIRLTSQQIAADAKILGDRSLSKLKSTGDNTYTLLLSTLFLISLVFIMMMGWVRGSFLNPILVLKRYSNTLTRGNYDQKVNISGKNEIADLAESFNHLSESIVEKIRQLESSFAETKSAETRYSAILRTAIDSIITIDDKGIVQSANPAAEKLLGYGEDELVGNNVRIIVPFPHHEVHDKYISNYIETHEAKIIGTNRQLQALHKNGYLIDINLSITEMKIAGATYFSGMLRDITKELEAKKTILESNQQLIVAKDEAENANRLKSEFLSRMSHELRTPMNAILGFGQLMKMGGTLEELERSNVDEILDAGNHLLKLINEVLDLSVIESGEIQLTLQDFTLDSWLTECVALVRTMAAKRDITINVNLQACNGVSLHMDRERLKEVLLNLLTNAVKYIEDKGSISINCEKRSVEKLRISVIDNGPGISEEQQALLFEPLNRLGAEYTDIEGTGIGLSIAKQLMGLMKGEIGVQSSSGKGSTFWIDCNLSPTAVMTKTQM